MAVVKVLKEQSLGESVRKLKYFLVGHRECPPSLRLEPNPNYLKYNVSEMKAHGCTENWEAVCFDAASAWPAVNRRTAYPGSVKRLLLGTVK